jgi:hypothetical protein
MGHMTLASLDGVELEFEILGVGEPPLTQPDPPSGEPDSRTPPPVPSN